MKRTIEDKVAMTILEEPVAEITLDGTSYSVPAPTTATIIEVSSLISELPDLDLTVPDEQLPAEVLSHAIHGHTLARIAATLMLGQKRIRERRTIGVPAGSERRWCWRRFRRTDRPVVRHITEIDHLTRRILDNCTTSQLREIIFALIKEGGLDDFFILTTSLHANNRLAPTREVEKTTAYGHS